MEVIVPRNELLRHVQVAQEVVQKKTTMPVLSHCIIRADKESGKLMVGATDLSIGYLASIDCGVKKGGEILVNSKVICDVVRELPEGSDLTIKVIEGERLEIISGLSDIKIIGLNTDGYPGVPGGLIKADQTQSVGIIREMIRKSVYASAAEAVNPAFTGVLIETIELDGEPHLRFVASDGHRLSLITRRSDGLNFSQPVLISRKALIGLSRLISALPSDTDICIGLGDEEEKTFLRFCVDGSTLSARLMDNEYPDYRAVIPKGSNKKVRVNSAELMGAIRRVALMSSGEIKGIKMDIFPDKMILSSSSPELGDSREEIKADFDGDNVQIGFNSSYLLDFISSLEEGQEIVMEVGGELSACKLYPSGDTAYSSVIMPLRIQ